MPCYNPLQASFSQRGDGKKDVVFSTPKAKLFSAGIPLIDDSNLSLPCGRCIGCRLERSRQWAVRCMHEAKLYDDNCFITLTYDDRFLPAGGTLVKEDFQLFMKRLRKYFSDLSIRYFACGEYGENFSRPHYHACIFNLDFSDKLLFSTKGGNDVFTSDVLSTLWPKGFSTVGALTFESAAYVSRYCLKKVSGSAAEEFYQGRQPEFALMSRRPGLGRGFYDRYRSDMYPHDYVISRGFKAKTPRYYDNVFELESPLTFAKIRERRRLRSLQNASDNTCTRLRTREVVKRASIKSLRRSLESVSE